MGCKTTEQTMKRIIPFALLAWACDGNEAIQPQVSAEPAGRCFYVNPFSQSEECKNYSGAGWSAAAARMDCSAVAPLGVEGRFEAALGCEFRSELGRCAVAENDPKAFELVFEGEDSGSCASTGAGCETFAGGTFLPSSVCDGTGPITQGPSSVFMPPYLDCRPPLADEPPGTSGDEVCTQTAISGCTEPGRRFSDYASCEDVRSQRPYIAYEIGATNDPQDARLDDSEYMAELNWVKDQVEACACVCCHSELSAPSGASGWSIDKGPLWIDTVPDAGLAMLAGLVDSTSFGAFPPEQNNGFSRDETGLPTTDAQRMKDFLTSEYLRRGFSMSDAQSYAAFGGPLEAQRTYVPTECGDEVGQFENGELRWSGGAARYVYVLQDGSANPGVPPNLDLPEGTIWRVDVPPTGRPIESGVRYGVLPDGAKQAFPVEGQMAQLQPGQTYYLYVLADVGLPLARCLFTAR